jgi:hypothetical protein
MASKLTSLALSLAASLLLLAPTANAQEFGLSIGKQAKRGHVSVNFGSRGANFSFESRGRNRGHGKQQRGYRRRDNHGHSAKCCKYVAGRFQTQTKRVWVQGACRQVWVPPVYDTYCDLFGNSRSRLIQAGYYQTIQEPGHYENQCVRVWVEGYRQCRRIGRY